MPRAATANSAATTAATATAATVDSTMRKLVKLRKSFENELHSFDDFLDEATSEQIYEIKERLNDEVLLLNKFKEVYTKISDACTDEEAEDDNDRALMQRRR